MATREELANKGNTLLNHQQEARMRQLNAVEQLLFKKLVGQLEGMLEENNGRIVSKRGFVSIAKAIDAIFDAIKSKQLGAFGASITKDMGQVLTFNANYYRVLSVNRGDAYSQIQERVNATMRKRLGIDAENGLVRKGYLDQLFQDEQARNEVKALVQKSVAAGVPMAQLKKALAQKVTGTEGSAGVMERTIGGFVLDAYQVADRATNNEFATRLALKYGIYSGGLIENTRAFCQMRNNKVFSTEEANRDWPLDPTLPRSKAEKDAGGPPGDYVPLEDMGRWNCRHRFLYISDEEAFRRRPELDPKPLPKTVRPSTLKKAPATAPPARMDNDLPPPPATKNEARIGPAHVPGTVANELRAMRREQRKSSQFEVADQDAVDTLNRYTEPNGKLTEQRAALHRQIVEDAIASVPASDNPTVYMMGGGTASGKSTLIKSGAVVHPDNHVLLNPDEFKEDLPEYREGVAARDPLIAATTHEESSAISKAVAKAAIGRTQDVVWDGTGDNTLEKLRGQINQYRDKGYRVVADYVTVPTEMAVDRSQKRGERTGRFVQPEQVRSIHRAVSIVLPQAIAEGLFDQVTLWDTSTTNLIKVASAKGTRLTILHQRLWQEFLAKGGEATRIG